MRSRILITKNETQTEALKEKEVSKSEKLKQAASINLEAQKTEFLLTNNCKQSSEDSEKAER